MTGGPCGLTTCCNDLKLVVNTAYADSLNDSQFWMYLEISFEIKTPMLVTIGGLLLPFCKQLDNAWLHATMVSMLPIM
jgi:hypothetical protein